MEEHVVIYQIVDGEDMTITHYRKPIFLEKREGNCWGGHVISMRDKGIGPSSQTDKSQRLVDYEEGVAAK